MQRGKNHVVVTIFSEWRNWLHHFYNIFCARQRCNSWRRVISLSPAAAQAYCFPGFPAFQLRVLGVTAGANPSFIASQLGMEDAQMVYRVYSSWIKEFNGDQVRMLNDKYSDAPTMPLKVIRIE